jgi:uncharacterized membrane protein
MSNCPHCGQEIEIGSESCSACGKSLPSLEETAASPSVPERIKIGEVKISDYLRGGWELFKKYPAGFIFYCIIATLIPIVIDLVPVIGVFAGLVLGFPLYAGFFVVSAKLLQKQTPEFADFFSGFKFFLQLALLGVVSGVLIAIGLLLLIVPGIYLAVSYLFALMFVVDRGLNFWQAMETSRRSVQTRWFAIFTFLLFIVLLNLGPILPLGLVTLDALLGWQFVLPILGGYLSLLIIFLPFLLLLVTVPLSHCIITVAYADIFGLKSAHNI